MARGRGRSPYPDGRVPVMVTCAPAAANARATPRPMPLEPPVTNTRAPAKSNVAATTPTPNDPTAPIGTWPARPGARRGRTAADAAGAAPSRIAASKSAIWAS